MSNLVVVAKYSFPHEANFAKMNLEGAGIPAFVADEHTVNMQWLYSDAMGGVRLFVHEPNLEQALEVLNSEEPIEYEESFIEQFEEVEEIESEEKSEVVAKSPVVNIGYSITKFICWLFLFRAIYFSILIFDYDGFVNSFVAFAYYGWIPITLIYFFHKHHDDGKGILSSSIAKFVLPFLGKSVLVIAGFMFLVWCVKNLTS